MHAAILASDVYDGFERGEGTLVTALDLEDVYNRVHYDILLWALVNMGFSPTRIIRIETNMLKRPGAMRLGC